MEQFKKCSRCPRKRRQGQRYCGFHHKIAQVESRARRKKLLIDLLVEAEKAAGLLECVTGSLIQHAKIKIVQAGSVIDRSQKQVKVIEALVKKCKKIKDFNP